MAIVGVGTDLVEIERVKRLLASHPKRFPSRILGASELAIFEEHSKPERYLAKRFAAKEAAVKALGTGIRDGINFADIETTNDEQGKPSLVFHGNAKLALDKFGNTQTFLSISDEKSYASAFVVIEQV